MSEIPSVRTKKKTRYHAQSSKRQHCQSSCALNRTRPTLWSEQIHKQHTSVDVWALISRLDIIGAKLNRRHVEYLTSRLSERGYLSTDKRGLRFLSITRKRSVQRRRPEGFTEKLVGEEGKRDTVPVDRMV